MNEAEATIEVLSEIIVRLRAEKGQLIGEVQRLKSRVSGLEKEISDVREDVDTAKA